MKIKLNSLSISLLVSSLSKCFFLGLAFPYIFHKTGTSSWISMLIGGLFSVIIILIILKAFNSGNGNIFMRINKTFGRFGYFLNIILSITSFLIFCLIYYRIVSFTSTEFLNDTPTFIIGLMIIIVIYYLSHNNLNAFFKFCMFSFLICNLILIFNSSCLLNYFDFNNIKPLFNSNIKDILESGIYLAFFFSAPLYILLMIPKECVIDIEKFNKYILVFMGLSFIVCFFIMNVILGVLGIELTNIFTYPEFIVLKSIDFLNFIQNVESISTTLWVLYIIVTSGALALFIKYALCEVFKIQYNNKIIIPVICIIVFIITSFLFDKEFIIERFNLAKYTLITFLVNLLIICLYLIVNKIKKINA